MKKLDSKDVGHNETAHYGDRQRLVAGKDESLKFTEVYDGFTDDFGTFKEGPPTTLRLEYIRSPEHLSHMNMRAKMQWSPFASSSDLRVYSPHYRDYTPLGGRDKYGHRGTMGPGETIKFYYKRKARSDHQTHREAYTLNRHPQRNVPKWLAQVVMHDWRRGTLIGFFLYANGAYCAEMLTYKQLPRLAYNKPYQGYIPTLGQTVELSEVTYGKEVHNLEYYPGYGGGVAIHAGCSVTVLRGTEANVVPMLLGSREVRLFDTSCTALYGRAAGTMRNKVRYDGRHNVQQQKAMRPSSTIRFRRVGFNIGAQSRSFSHKKPFRVDFNNHFVVSRRTKYWLNAYVLQGRQYTKHASAADLKSKTYSWASRDAVYRP